LNIENIAHNFSKAEHS